MCSAAFKAAAQDTSQSSILRAGKSHGQNNSVQGKFSISPYLPPAPK